MGTKEKTELVELRLPKGLREKLCSRQLMAMLEQAWLDAFARGTEFGLQLAAEVTKNKKKRRKKSKRKSSV